MGRYFIKFINGQWVAFDSHAYKNVDRFRTYREAVEKFVGFGYLPATALKEFN
jgi:hypothetical protein